MKKLFIFVLLLCVFAVPAMANTSRVTDNANLFTAVEEQGLQQRIDGIVQQYGIDQVKDQVCRELLSPIHKKGAKI